MNQTKPTVYALLVGINQYLGDVPTLNGCVNDVKGMMQYLESRASNGFFNLKIKVLTSGDDQNPNEVKPSRQAVIDAFRNTLMKAGPEDTAFFYFSGHGSQEKAHPQFWNLEPDHLDETLVCYDSRSPGSWDLADKELAYLIREVTRTQPDREPAHVIVILDSCHSGSGTRDPHGSQTRLAPQDQRDRPVDTFLPGLVDWIHQQATDGTQPVGEGNWISLPAGRHVVMSACRAEESAREKAMPDHLNHGVFSYFLLQSLYQVGPVLTYRDLFAQTSASVRNHVKEQNPVLESVYAEDILLPFLGGVPRLEVGDDTSFDMPYFNLYAEKDQGWFIDGGEVHGVAPPSGSETTFLKVFPINRRLEAGDNLEDALGEAQVIQVFGTRSRVLLQFSHGNQPSIGETYKGVVVSNPLVPCLVSVQGTDRVAVNLLTGKIAASPRLAAVDDPSQATLRVIADLETGNYFLQRNGDLQPLQVFVPRVNNPEPETEVIAKLEHIATWLILLELENRQSGIPVDVVEMEVYRYDPITGGRTEVSDLDRKDLVYNPGDDEWGVPIQIRIHHKGSYQKALYVMLVDMTEDFAVLTGDFLFGGGTWLQPGEEVWATDPSTGESFIFARVRTELVEQGITRFTDVLKMIVSTDASNAHLLAQERLQVAIPGSVSPGGQDGSRGIFPSSSFNSLIQRLGGQTTGTRDIGGGSPRGRLSDWRTLIYSLTTICQGGAVQLSESKGSKVQIAPGISIENHSHLAAKAQVIAFEDGKRDLGNLSIPAIFRNNPDTFQPFGLPVENRSRGGPSVGGDQSAIPVGGGEAGSSVLVLSDVSGKETVTAQSPLELYVQVDLSADEFVLPVGYDPELQMFIPVGFGFQEGDHVKVSIQTLPAPSSDTRSLGGSIKLFLQKVVSEAIRTEKTGWDQGVRKIYRLAAVSRDADGIMRYDDEPEHLQELVRQSERVLLILHGLFGDTQGMAQNLFTFLPSGENGDETLANRYDLILAFDYENINSSIEEVALELKKALVESAGLVPGHGKKVDAIAHSLGTQVLRFFIERDEGREIIARAVLAGPPNKGTPWAVYEDFIILGVAAALNGLVALISGPAVIATLVGSIVSIVKGVEAFDTTLDQLKPNSEFYKILNASGDPHVPYAVIAGNTSLIKGVEPARVEAETNVLKKLAEKLTSPQTRNQLLSLGFLNKPNDIAVSVESQLGLPGNRNPEPVFIQIACDHLSYFNSEAGAKAISDALGRMLSGR